MSAPAGEWPDDDDITTHNRPFELNSFEAHESVKHDKARLRARVLGEVAKRGLDGATAEEIERALHMHRSTASGRMSELKARGQIVNTGMRRAGMSGCLASVWMVPVRAEATT